MKKYLLWGVCQMLCACGFAEQENVIDLCRIDEKTIEDFSAGKMGESILVCPQGTRLPFSIKIKGTFLEVENAEMPSMSLKLLTTCFVRCDRENHFWFSSDKQHWREFSEFFTGELSVSIHAPYGKTVAGLQLDLNVRS